MKRRRAKAMQHCSNCGASGHNRRTCPRHRRNPGFDLADWVLKPAIAAAVGHVSTESTKAAIKRAGRPGHRQHRRK